MLESVELSPGARRRELILVLAAWLSLALVAALVAKQNLSVPGLYYDEAVFGGLAKDFVTGQARLHLPGYSVVDFLGRPFPVYASIYNGALKCWILIPAIALFGSSVAVLRLTSLLVALLALLLFMLSVRRWLGLRAAAVAGLVLIVDPTYFFMSLFDWGVATNSVLCKCGAFYLALIWWRNRKDLYLFLAALFLGLGVFNKVDFLAFLAGVGIAAACFYGPQLWAVVRARSRIVAICCGGFLLGTGPMTFSILRIVHGTLAGKASSGPGEQSEKLQTLLSMYDGSYFYRLMDVGGLFANMYARPAGVRSVFGLFVLIAIGALFAVAPRERGRNESRIAGFLLVSFALTTMFDFLVPGAVRIHHAALVFPLPQLIIAAAFAFLWNAESTIGIKRITRIALLIAIFAMLSSQARAILKTEKLMSDTGGRGLWSAAFDTFCRENRNRSDLTMISLDWGFNEQLAFLTDVQLVEPFWRFEEPLPPLPNDPDSVYLAHAPDYSVFGADVAYLNKLQIRARNADIQPYLNREGRIMFYTIHFRPQ
jgi:hypothetical protein